MKKIFSAPTIKVYAVKRDNVIATSGSAPSAQSIIIESLSEEDFDWGN